MYCKIGMRQNGSEWGHHLCVYLEVNKLGEQMGTYNVMSFRMKLPEGQDAVQLRKDCSVEGSADQRHIGQILAREEGKNELEDVEVEVEEVHVGCLVFPGDQEEKEVG